MTDAQRLPASLTNVGRRVGPEAGDGPYGPAANREGVIDEGRLGAMEPSKQQFSGISCAWRIAFSRRMLSAQILS
ncbi:MAG: hypothetical protein ABSA65_11800 [Acidimicrobiales bacterium]